MEDRRIIKTKKKNLKATLIGMMREIAFEQISITELCKRAEISRITFYSHYSDKYALVDDILMICFRLEPIFIVQNRNKRKSGKQSCNRILQYVK